MKFLLRKGTGSGQRHQRGTGERVPVSQKKELAIINS